MNNFRFYNPVEVVFGSNTISNLSTLVPRDKKVLITYGGGSIKSNGVYNQVMAALPKHRIVEFGGIEPNPEYETLCKAAQICKNEHIGFILSVGGGSVLDGSKFIAAAAKYAGEPWDFFNGKAQPIMAIPLGSVMTMPATGSEMNFNAVISRRELNEKRALRNPKILPKFTVLDPDTTISIPVRQRINGVVDSFVHIMEQYLTFDNGAYVSDNMAEGLLLTLVDHGKTYVQDPNNKTTASNIMWTSTMALNGLISCGVVSDWSTHGIGHIFTALYGLDHAQTLAVILPGVMHVMRVGKQEKILRYGNRIWGIVDGTAEERVDLAIAKTEEFFKSLGAKTRLSEYNIGNESIDAVVAELEKQNLLPLGENKNMDAQIIRDIISSRL